MAWQPLQTSRLPDFVYNWSRPGVDRTRVSLPYTGGKWTLITRQRLETPVVYFYSSDPQTVDVDVTFDQGWITEWFPRADSVTRSGTKSLIHWPNLRIAPFGREAEALTHPATTGDHYFAARATDSDVVKTKDEAEKFLFYRGAGNFDTPLRVTMKSDFSITLANTGTEAISELLVFQTDEHAGNFISVADLKPGEERTVAAPRTGKRWFPAGDELAGAVGKKMAGALVKAGLYPREAEAMVNTWDDSWFRENGLRVFYLLPRPWTDRVLPMTLKPAPSDLVRVMVGRAEVLAPGQEQELISQLMAARQGDKPALAQARLMLKGLGRFSDPALRRAVEDAQLQPEEQSKVVALIYQTPTFE